MWLKEILLLGDFPALLESILTTLRMQLRGRDATVGCCWLLQPKSASILSSLTSKLPELKGSIANEKL